MSCLPENGPRAYSEACRPPIPTEADHPFRDMSSTRSSIQSSLAGPDQHSHAVAVLFRRRRPEVLPNRSR